MLLSWSPVPSHLVSNHGGWRFDPSGFAREKKTRKIRWEWFIFSCIVNLCDKVLGFWHCTRQTSSPKKGGNLRHGSLWGDRYMNENRMLLKMKTCTTQSVERLKTWNQEKAKVKIDSGHQRGVFLFWPPQKIDKNDQIKWMWWLIRVGKGSWFGSLLAPHHVAGRVEK